MYPLIVLCNCLGILLGNLLLFGTIVRLIKPKHPWVHVWVSALLFLGIWAVNNYLLPAPSAVLDVATVAGSLVYVFCIAPRGHKIGGAVTSLGLFASTIAIMFVGSLFVFPIAEKLQIPPEVLLDRKDSFGNAIMTFLCQLLFAPVCLGYYRFVTEVLPRWHLSPKLLFFLPIPVSQIILMNVINRLISYVGGIGGIRQTYAFGVLLSIVADAVFVFGMWKVQQSEELRQQVRMANEQLDVQTDYYRQLQESILTVNQIRHDLNNQLQAAYQLMDSGETGLARRQLGQVQHSLGSRVGPRFSSNLMVDAVLSDKARLCREKDIRLSINTELPPELPVENAQLCSIFSNLLDNSIQGVLESGAQQKTIELQAMVRGNCLMISCANPARKPARKQENNPLRAHGLGLGILNTIASKYHGTLKTEYQDGCFRTDLCLPLPEKQEGETANAQ